MSDVSRTFDGADPHARLAMSPTDISQFIRLDQCRRYLRLRTHLRNEGDAFLHDADVAFTEIPSLLTQSGAGFEGDVTDAITANFPSRVFDRTNHNSAGNNNAELLEIATSLHANESCVLIQPRLTADLGGWRLTGELDVLHIVCAADGSLDIRIVDVKSSTEPSVEHRLQVAMYHRMVEPMMRSAGFDTRISLGILYRGPASDTSVPAEHTVTLLEHKSALQDTFGIDIGYLERIPDADSYLQSVDDLLLKRDSTARQVLATPFDQVPFHLTLKCDGCGFNEFCMKKSHQDDNLSLIPFITEQDKHALERAGIASTRKLADLKKLGTSHQGNRTDHTLKPTMLTEKLCGQLSQTWPVRENLDQLIYRAQSVRAWREKSKATSLARSRPPQETMPFSGYASFPVVDATHHPNLLRIYLDCQHDYLNDRLYLLGARVVACDKGNTSEQRTRSIVRLAEAPPTTHDIERDLFVSWLQEVIAAVADLTAPASDGSLSAPVHLVFNDGFAQNYLLAGLGRHLDTVLGTTALFDLMTQVSTYESPIACSLMEQVRKHKNYPMTCQTLQSISAFLGFDWRSPQDFRTQFYRRMFDFWGKATPEDNLQAAIGEQGWYLRRSRFNNQIPLEHAYAAWGDLGISEGPSSIEEFKDTTRDDVLAFEARRLEAMEFIAERFHGNRNLELASYDLSTLADFESRARTFAHALEEFILIERHVEVAAWKSSLLPEPDQRMINGTGLVLKYLDADQTPETHDAFREWQRRELLETSYLNQIRRTNPSATRKHLTKEQKAETSRSLADIEFRFRLHTKDADSVLSRTTLKAEPGARYIYSERHATDSREDPKNPRQFTPTSRMLLHAPRVSLLRFERDPSDAGVVFAVLNLGGRSGGNLDLFVAGANNPEAPTNRALYTLDHDINSYTGYWQRQSTLALQAGGANALNDALTSAMPADPNWTDANDRAQQRFMAGIDALHRCGGFEHPFTGSQREFIERHGGDPTLLVQGPPGTGKSYNTAFALLARMQGARATGRPFRILVSCKTHAAIDVVMKQCASVQTRLAMAVQNHKFEAEDFFDEAVLRAPLFRVRPKEAPNSSAITVLSTTSSASDAKSAARKIDDSPWCIVGMSPANGYKLIVDAYGKDNLTTSAIFDCVVLDEASQMSIPEGVMATLGLAPGGHLIVVGDHRQMPPIIRHDWDSEQKRTFREFPTFESLFNSLRARGVPMIRFEQSFRLHRDIAEFLRREVYAQDDINYRSEREWIIEHFDYDDPFVAAVLNPSHPLTVIVHDEATSQHANAFERDLMIPVLDALADRSLHNLDSKDGMGMVVPHRAQRGSLIEASEHLVTRDEDGQIVRTAVDTVERFQGSERDVVIVGATESDPNYILLAGDFLLDPRRLNVALSRAKRKIILVASRSIFDMFSADEETFRHAQLWKNLLRQTCTHLVWEGDRLGHHVQVWGNPPATDA